MQPKFYPIKELDGFDSGVNPQWQMVGVGNEKTVMLNDGNDLSVKVRHPAIAEIIGDVIQPSAIQRRLITVKGKQRGTTFLDVSDARSIRTHLEIGVKNRREIRVSFHFVYDNAGNHTKRTNSQLIEWLDIINNVIFLPQANVFVNRGIINDPLTINRNLGDVVRDTSEYPNIPKSEHEVDLIMSYGDKAANVNVFFVNKYEDDDTPDKNDVTGRQYAKGIFIEDLLVHPWATITSVLAHEIVHYLGVGGASHYFKSENIDGLMYFRARGGMRISKVHANMINR